MLEVTVWHNPRCARSREALEYLKDRGVPYREYHYLNEQPSEYDVRFVLEQLGLPARDLLRVTERKAAEVGITAESSEDAIIAAMVQHPIVIQRPIVITNDGAVIARPASRIDSLLHITEQS